MIPVLRSVLLVVVLVFIASSDVDATWPHWTWYNMWGRPPMWHSVPVAHVNIAEVRHQPLPSLLPISPCQAARADPSVGVQQQLLPLLLGGRPQLEVVHVVPQEQPIPCQMQAQKGAAKQPQNEAAKQPQKPSAGKKVQEGGADMSHGNVAGAGPVLPLRIKLYRG